MRRKARDIQVERLEWENVRLRTQIAEMRREPREDMPSNGCGNSPCYVATPQGMHTNGMCMCDERALRVALAYYRRRCDFLQATIQEMRDGRPEEGLRAIAERFIKETPE